MNADYAMPIYKQLKEGIKRKISLGEYAVGERIPSERELAGFYGITRVTVRNAIKQLEAEGILISSQGRGTYVAKMPEEDKKVQLGSKASPQLSVDIRMGGMRPSKIVLSLKKITLNQELSLIFKEKKVCWELTRLLLIDDSPYAVQIACFPYDLFKDADRHDFREGAFYDYLDSKGQRPAEILSELRICPAPEEIAVYLDLEKKKNVFDFTYFGYNKSGQLIEYTKSYNHPRFTSFKYISNRE